LSLPNLLGLGLGVSKKTEKPRKSEKKTEKTEP
jgi:hypothetical protein